MHVASHREGTEAKDRAGTVARATVRGPTQWVDAIRLSKFRSSGKLWRRLPSTPRNWLPSLCRLGQPLDSDTMRGNVCNRIGQPIKWPQSCWGYRASCLGRAPLRFHPWPDCRFHVLQRRSAGTSCVQGTENR